MANTTLQIPIDKKLRDKATKVASQQGFSSLQEAVRVFLSQFADREVGVRFAPAAPMKLSAKNDVRYATMVNDVKSGKVQAESFSDTDDLMDYLNS